MNYKKLNIYLGWLVFFISTAVYFMTIESTVSLWDCGEYITAAHKLEVGHPPGAPLFMLLGRLFSFFADPSDVAVWINRMSALSSSFTILFMFWSITMLAKKMAFKNSRELSKGQIIAILGSGFIGALAYTFTESFWFSAVEGEVYAMSSLFTAIIFWAMLKWDEEMDAIKHAELDSTFVPMRWMILIMFLFGLAIGVHLLGLLAIPAIAYVIYFNKWKDFSWKGFFLTGILSVFILGFIQEGIIPGTVALASKFEISFVNDMGMPFFSGAIFFFVLLIGGCVFLLRWSKKKNKPVVNAFALGFIVFLIGYGSFATIVIRSNANTPLDENDPENLVTLHAYLKREQYGSWPILSGPYWNSNLNEDSDSWGDRSPFYARRFVVMRADKDLKAFKSQAHAKQYAKTLGSGYDVVEKYFMTNDGAYKNQEPAYAQTTFFPRMYWSQDEAKTNAYIQWSGYDPNDDLATQYAEEAQEMGIEFKNHPLVGNDSKRLPTFGENLRYFTHYQLNWMYWRYFMWNFSGRQNDIQGHGDAMRGNWISGFSAIDDARLGDQASAPTFTTENPSHNVFFFLPLILGLIGMVFHFYKAPKDAFIVLLTFIFTGLAIVIYLNQKPFEPRERDYAYAASFYAFAIWIGLGVYALYQAFVSFSKKEYRGTLIVMGSGLVLCLLLDAIFNGDYAATMSWLIICGISAVLVFGMNLIGKSVKKEASGAVLAVLLTLVVPMIMGLQGWDDHDRSNKTSARDLAYNYLESCTKNSILFTNGDNDTFPLWYFQEVEEKRTDVRVCNLSLMQTDWYTEQMMMKAYDSDPLPITFREDQIMMYAGNTDQVYMFTYLDMKNVGLDPAFIKKTTELKINNNKVEFTSAFLDFQKGCVAVAQTVTAKNPAYATKLNELKTRFNTPIVAPNFDNLNTLTDDCIELLTSYSQGNTDGSKEGLMQLEQMLKGWEAKWDFLPMDYLMDFVKNDENQMTIQGRLLRVFPSKGFILPVNKENIVKSGLVAAADISKVEDVIKFRIDKPAITREQVMMLDVMNNNKWERNIYFSSPGGSDVSMGLYYSGYAKQNGMVFEMNPLRNQDVLDKDKMFKNLMSVYDYGKMNQEGVLSDYYTRRHTSQYRDHFSRLAEAFLQDAENEQRQKTMYTPQILSLRSAGRTKSADSLQTIISGADQRVALYKKKAIQLIKKSLEVMPIARVIEYGEPQKASGREAYIVSDVEKYDYFSDGIMHDYVGILYRAGDNAAAEKLGLEVASHIESTFKYFENSKAIFSTLNKDDLISALDNYFVLATAAANPMSGVKNGKLSMRTSKKISELYDKVFPRIYSDLKDDGYDKEALALKGHIDAVAIKFGLKQKPNQMPMPQGGSGGGMTPEQFQMMMDQQGQ